MKLIFAGACSIYGLSDIRDYFSLQNIEVSFIDAPFMADIPVSEPEDKALIQFTALVTEDGIIIPLSEYWISYCIRQGKCMISGNALKASRSKEFLNDLMKNAGLDFVKIFSAKEEAERFIEAGNRVIVKPKGLHSGYGVEIIDSRNIQLLEKYMTEAGSIKNRALRIMEIENEGVLLTECLEGTEYSADVWWNQGRMKIIRICRKTVITLHDKPCTLIYQLLSPEENCFEKEIASWMNVLFSEEDISFAQFDFIRTEDGRTIPIDFASRVGGGLSDLLKTAGVKYIGENKNECKNWTQFNYVPAVSGYVEHDDWNLLPGMQKIFKKKGDYVISNPSSVGSRIAIVVRQHTGNVSDEIENLLIKKI